LIPKNIAAIPKSPPISGVKNNNPQTKLKIARNEYFSLPFAIIFIVAGNSNSKQELCPLSQLIVLIYKVRIDIIRHNHLIDGIL
jgi:hypothetical protein